MNQLSIKQKPYIISPKINRILLHLLFWCVYIGIYTFQGGYSASDYWKTFIAMLSLLPVNITAAYFINYKLVPKYLFKKQYLKFILLFLIAFIVFVLLIKLIYYFVIVKYFFSALYSKGYYEVGFFYPTYLIAHAFNLSTVVFIFGFVKFIKIWFENQQVTQKLEKEKLEAEIKFLRAQMNPHFLFNVLNNIYSLALKKSDRTPDMILRLSSMLDFLLYETNADFIPIEKELKLINDYIELEKLRYGNRLDFEFNMEKIDSSIMISPLILFPLIENSFKHGASNELSKSWIKAKLNISENALNFLVENSKSNEKPANKGKHTEGIGLKNVCHRLELLYKNNYTIEIKDENDIFSVKLFINLSGKIYEH